MAGVGISPSLADPTSHGLARELSSLSTAASGTDTIARTSPCLALTELPGRPRSRATNVEMRAWPDRSASSDGQSSPSGSASSTQTQGER
jgi:hypothetical protein